MTTRRGFLASLLAAPAVAALFGREVPRGTPIVEYIPAHGLRGLVDDGTFASTIYQRGDVIQIRGTYHARPVPVGGYRDQSFDVMVEDA